MAINFDVIEAMVASYTVEELEAKRKEAVDKLVKLDMITSASGGGGSSYSRAERVSVVDLIEALNKAIKLKKGEAVDVIGQSVSVVIFRNVNY